MRTCEFCGAEIPDRASFCGACGQAPSSVSSPATRISDIQAVRLASSGAATVLSMSSQDHLSEMPTALLPDAQAAADFETVAVEQDTAEEKEEEDEKRRRAALMGLAFPLIAGAVGQGQPNTPVVQGTPQIGGAPSVQGTPQLGGGNANMPPSPHGAMTPGVNVPFRAPASPPLILPAPPTLPAPLPLPTPPPSPGGGAPPTPGCITWLIVIIIPLIIIVSIFGVGTTVFAPNLNIVGNSNVTIGGTFHLHGSNFLPGNNVTLTLDGSIPLHVAIPYTPAQAIHHTPSPTELSLLAGLSRHMPTISNTVTVKANGTFDIDIPVSQDWRIGHHTIRAAESLSPRSATLSFTVGAPGQTPIPTATSTATVTPTPPSTTLALGNVNPGAITLGPVTEGYNQAVSTQVTLATTGSGLLSWAAAWNQNQAPWLRLSQTSGQVLAPNAQQITVSALASGLKAGNYSATITFTSPLSAQVAQLTVSFAVQTGCVSVTPRALTFSGIEATSNPAPRTITLNNCGSAVGTWTERTSTAGGNWLAASPTAGNLNGGGTQTITVTASNLNAGLKAGTYQGSLIFSNGSGTFTVAVTLNVQALPRLSVSSPSINANTLCSFVPTATGPGFYRCFEVLTSIKGVSSLDLNWSASSTGIPGITITPTKGTLAPGQSTRVEIDVPDDCLTATTITFAGPANTIHVPWTCTAR